MSTIEIKLQRGIKMKQIMANRFIKPILLSAVFMTACAWPSLLHANSLSSDVIGMFPKNVGEFAYAALRPERSRRLRARRPLGCRR